MGLGRPPRGGWRSGAQPLGGFFSRAHLRRHPILARGAQKTHSTAGFGARFLKKIAREEAGPAFHLRTGAVIGLILNPSRQTESGRQNTLCSWILVRGLQCDVVTW